MVAAMPTNHDRLRSPLILTAALLVLGGCGQGENEPGPGGVTVGEAKALDEAAEMLEDQRLPAEAVPAPRDGAADQPAQKPAAKPAN